MGTGNQTQSGGAAVAAVVLLGSLLAAPAGADVPIATDDEYGTTAGVALDVAAPGVLGNDTATDDATLSLATEPENGSVVLDGDGSFVYTPDPGFSGTDSFIYELAQPPSEEVQLLADIWSGTWGGLDSSVDGRTRPVVLDGFAYFVAAAQGFGWEVWRTDGTPEGTAMVRDINPGPADAFVMGAPAPELFTAGNYVYFRADDGSSGGELWRTDGTSEGTQRVTDLNPGPDHTPIGGYVTDGTRLIFAADVGGEGRELFSTDGDSVALLDTLPGEWDGLAGVTGSNTVLLGDQLIYPGALEYQQWEPTARGLDPQDAAVQIANVNGTGTSSHPTHFTVAGDRVVFSAKNPGLALYSVTATPGSLQLIESFNLQLGRFIGVDGGVFTAPFGYTDGMTWTALGDGDLNQGHLQRAAALGSELGYYANNNDGAGAELWASDGTPEGTRLVKDIHPTGGSVPQQFNAVGDLLYFTAAAVTTREIYRTDLTEEGTERVEEAIFAPDGTRLRGLDSYVYFTGVEHGVMFFAWTPDTGTEPWVLRQVPGAADTATVEIEVQAATSATDLQVSLVGSSAEQVLNDTVDYKVQVHNAGTQAVPATLTIELEHRNADREQASWAQWPSGAITNGIFTLELDDIAPGATAVVPLGVTYEAFGQHGVVATVAGAHDDPDPANDTATLTQQIDLPLDTPGLQHGGFTVEGGDTLDGAALAVTGVRIPGPLVAGDPPGDVFVPAALTPGDLLAGGEHVTDPPDWDAADQFLPAPGSVLSGSVPLPVVWPGDELFVVGSDHWADGVITLPATWSPPGLLKFSDGTGSGRTDVNVGNRNGATMHISRGGANGGDGLSVETEGGAAAAAAALCDDAFATRVGLGASAAFSCGSLTTQVIDGEVAVELDDGTVLDIPAGTTVAVTERDGGGWDVTVLDGDPITITTGEHTFPLAAGETAPDPAGDPDGDGFTTAEELANGWDPLDPGSPGPGGGDNQPPIADAGGAYLVPVGGTLALDGSASDDPDDDVLTFEWTLDGETAEGVITTIQAPSEAGLYQVELTVTDPSGAQDTASVEVAVYDPAAASVTGAGWFDSPPGATAGAPSAEGRATIGFHVRYKKGRSTPDGHARFAFESGGIHLMSSSFEWLITGGKKAHFRGEGLLEGLGAAKFEVVAQAPDTVRVRIWDGDGAIYDSGQALLGGGRIVIQK